MDTSQTQMQPAQEPPQLSLAAMLKLLAQPTLKPLAGGNHIRAGVTKNHMQGESKARRRMAKESRRRNRGTR